MTARTARTAPAVSDTQSMPIVEVPIQRLVYTADVLDLFRKKIEEAVGSVETWAQQNHDQIDAHARDRIAQLRQAVEDIEAGNMLRIGSGPAGGDPYASTSPSDARDGDPDEDAS